jgi:hypothetical protein
VLNPDPALRVPNPVRGKTNLKLKLKIKLFKLTKVFTVAILAGFALVETAEGQSSESLLKKLVEKGVLTEAEAGELRNETNAENVIKPNSWVDSITFKGDLRLRYEQKHQDWNSGGQLSRQRMRYRFRYGAIADLQNDMKVGFRIASGSTDNPTSTNQSFDDAGHNDSLNIDQAYAQWSRGGFTVMGGKMPAHDKTGWMINKGLIDSDYTPEGLEAHYDLEVGNLPIGLHGGWHSLYESSGETDDEGLLIGQLTTGHKFSGNTDLKLGLGSYWLFNADQIKADTVGSAGVAHKDSAGNSESGNKVVSNFNPYFLDAALTYKGWARPLKFSAMYLNNPAAAASSEDTGYSLGVKYGSAKKAGEWEIGYEWRHLEQDSAWAGLTDSDFGAFGARNVALGNGNKYYNGTNVEGSLIKGKYQLYDNVKLGFGWGITDAIKNDVSGTDKTTHRFSFDVIFSF